MFGSEKRAMDKELENQQEAYEQSDDAIERDSIRQNPNYPSNIMPEDFYQYKKFVNLPESQAEFEGKIDKDVVFGNFQGAKPSIEELRFQIGTIELFESEFVEEKDVLLRDGEGNIMVDKSTQKPIVRKIKIFDEEFRGSLDYLKAEYKFAVVASRALGGHDRAGVLDVTTHGRITKEFMKKKDKGNALLGTGGG